MRMVPRNGTGSRLASSQADGLAGRAAAGELEGGGNCRVLGAGLGIWDVPLSGRSWWCVSLSSLLGCRGNLRVQSPPEP